MLYSYLGKTGMRVSLMCAGSLSVGPLQANLTLSQGRYVMAEAYEAGVNFFDSAEFYRTYPYLREVAQKPDTVIAGRSFAWDAESMRKSLDLYRKELNRDVVDIFGLHEQESGLTLKGHRDALEFLARERERGTVRAVSVSTHYVACVKAAALLDEVDVIFAVLNIQGLGIADGSRQDMEDALRFAKECGKGVYIMKALGGGHLHHVPEEALSYAAKFPYKDSVAVGVKTREEVLYNAAVLCGERPSLEVSRAVTGRKKRLLVEEWCEGCGRCVRRCGFKALSLQGGRAVVDETKCMLCGYCGGVCPLFCLKII